MAKRFRTVSKKSNKRRIPTRLLALGPGIDNRVLADVLEFTDELIVPHVEFRFYGKKVHPRGTNVDRKAVIASLMRYAQQFFEYVVTPALFLDHAESFRDQANCSSVLVPITNEPYERAELPVLKTPNLPCLVRVTRNPMRLWYGDSEFEVDDPDYATFVEELIKARGFSVSGTDIKGKLIDEKKRLDRMIKKLPEPIRKLVKGGAGRGYRLLPEAWHS